MCAPDDTHKDHVAPAVLAQQAILGVLLDGVQLLARRNLELTARVQSEKKIKLDGTHAHGLA